MSIRVMVACMYLAAAFLLPLQVSAQSVLDEKKVPFILNVPAAVRRTMPTFEPRAPLSSGDELPFRPPMGNDEYNRRKQKVAGAVALAPASGAGPSAPPLLQLDFEGLSQGESGKWVPPDTHGAIGRGQFVEVVNSRIAVFDTAGTRLADVSLAAFLGYTERLLFDPRVVYDGGRDRWIVSAVAVPESPTTQFHFIGVSTTGDAMGDFYIYPVSVAFAPEDLWDFPQLGMTSNGILVTANVFERSAVFKWADALVIPKDDLYAGAELRVAVFQDLEGSLTPPIVLDDHPAAFLIAARPGSASIGLYMLENSGDPDTVALSAMLPVAVDFYDIPPNARQPETPFTIDTSDARFVNASVQSGPSLFNVHTINDAGFARPRWYEIDMSSGKGTIVQTGTFFGAATSDDWNASIAVSPITGVFVTWSSSAGPRGDDPGYFPQIRLSGRSHTDPPGVIDPGAVVFQSVTVATPPRSRWGDYSAITVDPLNPRCAWGVNEATETYLRWASRIFSACFPADAGWSPGGRERRGGVAFPGQRR